jgi:hypothetical protein
MNSKLAGVRVPRQPRAGSGDRPPGQGRRLPGAGAAPRGLRGSAPGQAPRGLRGSSPGPAPRGLRGSSPGQAPRGFRGSSPGQAPRGFRGSSPGQVRSAQARPGAAVAAPRTPFILLILGLLGGGLVCLLVINTTLDASSFKISQLQQSNTTLAQQEQTLQREVSAAEAPAQIEQLAYQLGMRPVTELHFLDVGVGTRSGHHAGSSFPSRTAALGGSGSSRLKGTAGRRGRGGEAR